MLPLGVKNNEVIIWKGVICMAFDYKKEYREFNMPKTKPEIVTVPEMNFLAVRGSGDPNMEG